MICLLIGEFLVICLLHFFLPLVGENDSVENNKFKGEKSCACM